MISDNDYYEHEPLVPSGKPWTHEPPMARAEFPDEMKAPENEVKISVSVERVDSDGQVLVYIEYMVNGERIAHKKEFMSKGQTVTIEG